MDRGLDSVVTWTYPRRMPTVMKLQGGDKIDTDEDPQALAERFDAARGDGTLVKVDGPQGQVWINPHALTTISHREPYATSFS